MCRLEPDQTFGSFDLLVMGLKGWALGSTVLLRQYVFKRPPVCRSLKAELCNKTSLVVLILLVIFPEAPDCPLMVVAVGFPVREICAERRASPVGARAVKHLAYSRKDAAEDPGAAHIVGGLAGILRTENPLALVVPAPDDDTRMIPQSPHHRRCF